MEPNRELKGGDPQIGLRGRNPVDGNSREEPHGWELVGGTLWMGTQGRSTMDGHLNGETPRWDFYGRETHGCNVIPLI